MNDADHDVAALPELLQDAGYLTLMTGKWHLGYRNGLLPVDRGFDKSWALLNGCSNHFGYVSESQTVLHGLIACRNHFGKVERKGDP